MRNLSFFVLIIALSSFIACANFGVKNDVVACSVGEYSFTLGSTFEETSKTWPDLKREEWFESSYNDTKIYMYQPGPKTITFFFFKDTLSRVEFTVKPEDFKNAGVTIGGNQISFDLSPDAKTEKDEQNYSFKLFSFEIDGDTTITSVVELPGAMEKMRKE